MLGHLQKLLLTTTALVPLGVAIAIANPQGPQVVGGSATVQGQGTPTVTVTQTSNSAIVNWNTFNIGAGEKTNIVMPSASSVQLDRVTGGLGPSQILGSLWSNGRVFLVNPDGILFGPGSKVDTAGFLATTNNISNSDFMAGKYNFTIPGNPNASIVNQGTITAQSGGFAALVAPGVRNSGTITAKLGTVALASGNAFTLDFYGDKLIALGVNDAVAASVVDVATGQPLRSLVSNDGKLKANGGTVELTAVAARQVVDSVINTTGVIEANSVGTRNGMIVLGAATAATKPADVPTQTVKVSGKLSATGKKNGSTGGTIVVTGEAIALAGAKLSASGRNGGGTVLIGGDVGGGNPNPAVASISQAKLQSYAVPTASNVMVDATSTISASAKSLGDGGKVVVWADQSTLFDGNISARGGKNSGNGGFVETSGGQLKFLGSVDTAARKGFDGTLLLDPTNVTITDTGLSTLLSPSGGNPNTFSPLVQNDAILLTSDLVAALAASNVVVTTTSAFGMLQLGNITVAAPVGWSNANTLTLNAANNVVINAAVTAPNGGLTLNASNDIAINAAVTMLSGRLTVNARSGGFGSLPSIPNDFTISSTAPISVGTFTLQNGTWAQVASPLPAFTATNFRVVNGAFLRAAGGNGTSNSPYSIADIYGLQAINFNSLLNQNFALANDIDASAAPNWNNSHGFISIGTSNVSGFTGSLDGQGHVVSNLTTPLFSGINSAGTVSNLGLTNVNINVTTANAAVGALAPTNLGTITSVYASGSVSAGPVSATTPISTSEVGGLVGHNGGTITKSYAAVTVVGGNTGGLVGTNDGSGVISQSFASGSVSGTNNVGGLVGINGVTPGAVITQSYATGSVTGLQSGSPGLPGSSSAFSVGGLVGDNNGTITQSYATGLVTGALPPTNAGIVSGPGSATGGLIGTLSGGTLSSNYWDTQSTGQSDGVSAAGQPHPAVVGTGMTTAQLKLGLPGGFNTEPLPILSPNPLAPPLIEQSWGIGSGINSGYPYLLWQVAASSSQYVRPVNILSQLFNLNNNFAINTTVAGSTPATSSTPQSTTPSPNFETIGGQNVYVPPPRIQTTSPSAPAAGSNSAQQTNVVTSPIGVVSLVTTTIQTGGQQDTVKMVVVGGNQIQPLSQLDASLYATTGQYKLSPTTLDTATNSKTGNVVSVPVNQETCLATVYLMIAKAFGDSNASLGKEMILNPPSNNPSEKYYATPDNLPIVDKKSVTTFSGFDYGAVSNSITSGHLAILKFSAQSSVIGSENHFMLAVGVDATNHTVIANDPWTGTTVQINSAGKISSVMDPITKQYVNVLDSAGNTYASGEPAPTTVKNLIGDLGTVPGTTRERFSALSTLAAQSAAIVQVNGQ